MKLVIISHTQHYKNSDGSIVGWGPTITEINHLTLIFDEIYHIAVLTNEKAPKSAIPYTSDTIHFVPLKEVGGLKVKDKFNVLLQIPNVIKTVNETLKKVTIFQFRAPTGMGVYLIPYLTFFTRKKGWFKYAGNWKEENAALGFTFQRWFLKKQKRKVTINGAWKDQKKQCISFENPCLTDLNRENGLKSIKKKGNNELVNYCFVGTFYKRKGIDKILEALSKLTHPRMGTFYFVGAGGAVEIYKQRSKKIKIKINFTGFLAKSEINEVYRKCQYIVLPSDNEGFPKVIGEAMNYGCVPIVSNVSCIGQYIENKKNGFLIEPNTVERLTDLINESLLLNSSDYYNMVEYNYRLANKFTYAYYNKQLQDKIVNF